jgi:hypothetical protein
VPIEQQNPTPPQGKSHEKGGGSSSRDALPLSPSWHLWHGYPTIAAALMAACFAIIFDAFPVAARTYLRGAFSLS